MGIRSYVGPRTSKGRAHSTASLFFPDGGIPKKTVMLCLKNYFRTRGVFAGHSADPHFSDKGNQKKGDVLFFVLCVKIMTERAEQSA